MTLVDASASARPLLDQELRQWLEKTLSGRAAVQLIMPRDPGALWAFIRRQADREAGIIDSAVLFEALPHLDPSFITDYLTRLCRGGYLAPLGEGRFRVILNQPQPPQLRADGRPLLQALIREQIWRTLKMAGWITPRELAMEASTDEARVSEGAAQLYLAYLHRAGIVGGRSSGVNETAYRLKPGQGRGAAAPRVLRAILVWDENARAVAGRTIVASGEVRL